MENTIIISKSEYESLLQKARRLKQLEQLDYDLIRQFKDSLEDVKAGRIRRVA